MRLLLQRVKEASVNVAGEKIGAINQGILVFIGIHQEDTTEDIPWMINKLLNLRIFNDENHKMNLSITDIKGEILLISQFTLYGECKNGRRPDFFSAASGEKAHYLYDQFILSLEKKWGKIQTGAFGASMQVSLVNDGPVTLLIENQKKIKLN